MTKPQALTQMATLVAAGLPAVTALERLERDYLSARARKRLRVSRELMARRMLEGDFISPSEASQVSLALETGRLEPCLKNLARAAEQRQSRRRRLGSRLWLSLGLLVVGLLASLAVALFRPEVPALQTLSLALWPNLIPPLGLMSLSRWLMTKDQIWWANGCARWPWASGISLLRRNLEITWAGALYHQYDAGRDPITAVKSLRLLAVTQRLRRALDRAVQHLQAGSPLYQSLVTSGLPLSRQLLNTIQTGERSGRLSDLLGRWLNQAESDLNTKLDLLLEWWPRLLYALSAVSALHMLRTATA